MCPSSSQTVANPESSGCAMGMGGGSVGHLLRCRDGHELGRADDQEGDAAHVVSVAGIVTYRADGGQQDQVYDGNDDIQGDLGVSSANVEKIRHTLVRICDSECCVEYCLRYSNRKMNDTDSNNSVHKNPRSCFGCFVVSPTET